MFVLWQSHDHVALTQLPEVNDQLSVLCSDFPFVDVLYNINIYCKFWRKPFDTRIFNKHTFFTFINMKILLLQLQWVFPLLLIEGKPKQHHNIVTCNIISLFFPKKKIIIRHGSILKLKSKSDSSPVTIMFTIIHNITHWPGPFHITTRQINVRRV